MFEKEAEKYLKKILKRLKIKEEDLVENQPKFISWEKMNFISLNVSNVSKAFQDGAEFGFNKANEWHYVKDEGTPKVEGHYLVCLRNKDHDIFDCWIYYDKDVGWYSMKVRMKDIYAWKEIVLPKEEE